MCIGIHMCMHVCYPTMRTTTRSIQFDHCPNTRLTDFMLNCTFHMCSSSSLFMALECFNCLYYSATGCRWNIPERMNFTMRWRNYTNRIVFVIDLYRHIQRSILCTKNFDFRLNFHNFECVMFNCNLTMAFSNSFQRNKRKILNANSQCLMH